MSERSGRRISATPRLFWAVLVVLFVFAAAGAAAFLVLRPAEVTHENSDRSPAAAGKALSAKNSAELDRDDDADGLKNWQEALWRTDPKNPDTDGDGTNDGSEIRAGRNPLVPGPNDKAEPGALAAGNANAEAGNSYNLTEQFLGKVEAGLLPTLRERGANGEISPEAANAILPAIGELDPEKVLAVPKVTAADLVRSGKSDAATIKKYFNDFAAIYTETFPSFSRDSTTGKLIPAFPVGRGADANDPAVMFAVLRSAFSQLKNLPVPASFEDFAITELTYLRSLERIAEVLQNAERDPLAGIVAVTELQAQTELIQESRKKTLAELLARSIAFKAGDNAYAFLNP